MSRTHFAYILATIGFALILTAFPWHKDKEHIIETTPTATPQIPAGEGMDETSVAPEATQGDIESLPVFTKETLARYNGEDTSLPIYIAFEGNVYDVTAGKRFYEPGGAYDFLSGTDGTELLKVVGGSTIKAKYPVVGTYAE